MAINVRGPKTPKISVTQGDQGVAAIIVRTGGGSTGGSGLGSIPGVNVSNVQNNQTIFYNSASGTFDARFVNLRFDSTDNYVESLFAGQGITIPNPTGHAQQPVISLTPSGVIAGTYGSNVSIPVIVVDTYGRVNTISNLAITSNILPLSSNTGIYFNKETGVFFLGQNVDTTSNVTFNNVAINNLSALGNVTAQYISANVWSGIYTANVVETSGNLYLTNARVRTALSVNDQGGDGSLTYNNANGQFTYIGPSSAEVRAHLSSIDAGGDGAFSYDQANGVFTYTGPSPTEARAHLAGSNGIYYNNANGVFNIGQNVDTTSNVTFNDVTVSGKLYSNDITFNDITVSGNLTVVGTTTSINTEELNIADNKIVLNSDLFGSPSQSAGIAINRGTQANVELLWNESLDVWTFTNDGGIYYLVPTSTTDLIEGTNLYYTNARARASVSINDQGGDGSITYNSANGQFTYIGPSPTEVRAHLNTSTGLFYNNANGVFHLRDTAVTPNTYGGSTKIPVITIDQQGRITNAANIDVAGVTNFTAVGNTFTIFTADGNTFSSSIQQDSIVLARDTTGPYVANLIASTGVSIFNLGDENSVPTISIGQNVYSSQAVVFANVAAHTFTGNLYGNNITTTNKISANSLTVTNDITAQTITGTDKVNANSLSVTNDITAQTITANVWSGIYTANVVETSGNLYFTNARVRTALSVNDQGGDGSLTYNNANGQFTYIGPSPTEVRAHLSSVDTGGDGSFSYDNVTGVFTYTGPSPTEVRAHIAGSNGVYYNNANGVFNIGQNVDVTSDVTFNNVIVNGSLLSNDITADTITVKGNLIVDGSTTTVNTEEINLADNKILLNSNHIGVPSQDGGIIINRGSQANVDFIWNETKDIWEFTNDGTTYWPVPTSTTDLKEGANLYYTTARVLTDTGPTFERANAALAMANLVYGSSNVKVGTVAGVNNTSISNVVLAAGVQQTGILNTSNVIEGSNLYYTTARVLVDTANVFNQANTARNLANAVYDHANLVYSSSNVKVGTVAGVNNTSISNVVLAAGIQQTGILNTSNVIEGANLYYTTARVLVDTANAFNQANTARNLANAVYDHANLVYGSSNVKVGTVAGVNNTSISNVVLASGVYQTGIFNTSNVIEGSNLYYTTARVLVDTANAFNQANTARNLANAVYDHANLVYSSSNVKVGTVAGVNNTSISNVVLAAGIQQTGILNTSNVIEGSNLYYTTARVLVDTANVFDQANTARNLANAVYNSSNVKVGTVAGVNNTSISNVVLAAGIQQTGILNTSNVIEGSNLYYTTARVLVDTANAFNQANTARNLANAVYDHANLVYSSSNVKVGTVAGVNNTSISNVVLAAGVQQTGILNTSNVIEGSNLYYTTARVLIDTANAFNQANTARNLANAVYNQANLVYDSSNVKVGTVAGVNATSISNVVLAAGIQQTGILNTSNVIEGSNLYYTTARVLTDTGPTFERANAALSMANLVYGSSNVKVGTVAGVNNTSISNVVLAAGVQQTGILNTSNVVEGSNLYFTTQRARDSITANSGAYYNSTTGTISIGQNVDPTSNVIFNNMILTGNLNVQGNGIVFSANTLTVQDPLIQLGYGNPGNSVDIGFVGHYNDGTERHAGLFRDATDGKFKFFANLTPFEPGETVIDIASNTFSLATVAATTFEGNLIGNVTGRVSTLDNFTTSNVVEGANLYYTTARVLTDTGPTFERANAALAMANLVYGSSNVKVGTVAGVNNTSISNVVLAAGIQQTGILNTSNVIEGSNLYYTTARVLVDTANVFDQANTARNLANAIYDSSNVKVGTVAGVNATSISNVVLAAGVQQTGIFNTSNVIEGSNLYYTTARVLTDTGPTFERANAALAMANLVYGSSNVKVGTVAGVNATSISNVVIAAGVQQTGILNTSNVIEGSNLYYTTARVLIDTANAFNQANTARNLANAIYDSSNVKVGTVAGVNATSISNVVLAAGVQQTGIFNTSNVIEGSNLYYTTARVLVDTANVFDQANTARNLANLVYDSSNVKVGTVAGVNATSISNVVLAAGVQQTGIFNTSNVIEGINLYYTTARVLVDTGPTFERANAALAMANLVYGSSNVKVGTVAGVNATSISNIVLAAGIQQTGILNTSNVIEGSNLYYTTARVLVDTANVFDQANTARNLANAVYDQANLVYSSSNVKVGTVAGVNNTSISNVVLAAGVYQTGIFNTSNVAEGSNLYYTTARVLTDTGPTFERANAALAMANLVYGSSNVKVGTVAGVNNTSISNVVLAAGVQQTGIFNTSNVIEGSNLYYTNARVRATIFANSGVYYNESTGTFGIGQNVDTTSNVTFNDVNVSGRLYSDDITAANVTVNGNLTVTGTVTTVNTEEINLADNKILLNSNFAGTPTENGGFIINRGNLANTEFIWNEFNDRWEFTNNGTVYYPVATSTTDLQEGANLYYTNARARLAISANSNILYNSTTGTISLDSNVLTTANVVESSNRLYYTNARVITAVQETSLSNITVLGNVAAGNINITGRITGDGAGLSNVSVGALIGFTTQNVTEVVNLYFTNARSRAAISAGTGLVYNESTGVIRVDPNTQGGGGGGADFAASLIYSQP